MFLRPGILSWSAKFLDRQFKIMENSTGDIFNSDTFIIIKVYKVIVPYNM